jgi:predicted RNase H-like HicB family nuclease
MPIFILTGYIQCALAGAQYDKLEDSSYCGTIPGCKGVIAFGKTLRECEQILQSVLEEWVLLGLKMGHPLPILAEYDLNQETSCESMATL